MRPYRKPGGILSALGERFVISQQGGDPLGTSTGSPPPQRRFRHPALLLLSSHHSRPHQSTPSSTTPTFILSTASRFHDNTSSIHFWTSSQRRRQPNKAEQDGLLVVASNPVALVRHPLPLLLYPLTPTPPPSSCIAHRSTILSECTTSASSQTSSLASLILPKIDHSTPQKLTYTHGTHHIHYISEAPSEHPASNPSAGGLVFLVVADSALGRRIPFGFLVEARNRFFARYPAATTDFADLPDYGAAAFNGDLRTLMVDYGTTGAGRDDALSNARREIDDVRGIMTRNIEGLLERGERIDLLVDKTDRLGGSAREFRVRSRGLKRRMWWKNVKLMSLLGLVLVLIIMTIVISIKSNLG